MRDFHFQFSATHPICRACFCRRDHIVGIKSWDAYSNWSRRFSHRIKEQSQHCQCSALLYSFVGTHKDAVPLRSLEHFSRIMPLAPKSAEGDDGWCKKTSRSALPSFQNSWENADATVSRQQMPMRTPPRFLLRVVGIRSGIADVCTVQNSL